MIINKSVAKIGDLKPMLLACCLTRVHGCLTELSIMRLGGELAELRRKHLVDFKAQDSSQSLELRLSLAQNLATAEKSWRNRLVQVLTQGQGFELRVLVHICSG